MNERNTEISAAMIARGYLDVGSQKCLESGCENYLDVYAITVGFPGCMCTCRHCLEKTLGGETLEHRMATFANRRVNYPTTGVISADDPSIWGSAVLGWEGSTWAAFNRRNERTISPECPEPYRRGIGQGFGDTEDGQ